MGAPPARYTWPTSTALSPHPNQTHSSKRHGTLQLSSYPHQNPQVCPLVKHPDDDRLVLRLHRACPGPALLQPKRPNHLLRQQRQLLEPLTRLRARDLNLASQAEPAPARYFHSATWRSEMRLEASLPVAKRLLRRALEIQPRSRRTSRLAPHRLLHRLLRNLTGSQ